MIFHGLDRDMASSSNADRRALLLQEIDQLMEWIVIQYIFLDDQLPTIIDSMKSNTPNRNILLQFVLQSRGHKENTHSAEDSGYEKLLNDIQDVKKDFLNGSDMNKIRERLTKLEQKFNELNSELNREFKKIKKLFPHGTLQRIVSQHIPVPKEMANFRFSTPTSQRNVPQNRNRSRSPTRTHNGTQRRGRNGNGNGNGNENHSNITHRARRPRSASAMRNLDNPRPSRGSIRFNKTARGTTTFHINNVRNRVVPDPLNPLNQIIEPGMTHTGNEIKHFSSSGTQKIWNIYYDKKRFREYLKKWAENAPIGKSMNTGEIVTYQKATYAASTVAHQAAEAAAAAAKEAQHIASISSAAQDAASIANRAALSAKGYADAAAESFSLSAAYQYSQRATAASDAAIAALRDAEAAAAASNRRNST